MVKEKKRKKREAGVSKSNMYKRFVAEKRRLEDVWIGKMDGGGSAR